MNNAWRALASVTVAAALVVAPLVATGAVAEDEEPEKKVYVCKYVGTPGEDERLQEGGNPLWVSVNTIKDGFVDGEVVEGSFFSDDQGRSYVVAFDTGQPAPDESACPQDQDPVVTTLGIPTVQDFCFTSSDHYVAPSFPAPGVTYSDGADWSIIATVADGYIVQELPDGWINGVDENTYEYPFNPDQFTDDDCGFPTVSIAVDCETESGVVVTAHNPGESAIGVSMYVDFNLDGEVDWTQEEYAGSRQLAPGDNVLYWDLMHEIDWASLEHAAIPIMLLWGESPVYSELLIVECVPSEPVLAPAQFNVTPSPTCSSAAVFDLAFLGELDGTDGSLSFYDLEHITVGVRTNVPGQVYLLLWAHEGYFFENLDGEKWDINEEHTVAERNIVLPGPIGYQSENPGQPCFFSIVPQPAAPVFTDACGTAGDGWTAAATGTYTYAEVREGDTVTVTAVLTSEADEWAEGTVTEWSHTFTNVACPPPALAATGGSDLQPLGWAAFAALLAGAALLGYRKFASR